LTCLPDLARFDRVAVDTETAGLGFASRPVGLSIALPGPNGFRDPATTTHYFSWAHEGGGNNVTVEELRAWAARELTRPNLLKIWFNAAFDLRMLAYTGTGDHGLPGVGVPIYAGNEDGGIVAPILNEIEDGGYSLDNLLKRYTDLHKEDTYLNEWCAAQFGGKPTRQAQAPNYWRVPWGVMDEYAQHDALGTGVLYEVRRPVIDTEGLAAIYGVETALIPILLRMHLVGVRADVARAKEVKKLFEDKLAAAMVRWEQLAPGVNPMSGDQLGPVLDAHGLPYPRTEKTKKPSITTEVLNELDHPIAALIIEIREASKYAGTFVDSYILQNADPQGVIHGEFHQLPNDTYGAVSGRFSSGGSLNLQNLPGARHPELAKLIRGLFIPYLPGLEWTKADYSQIEYRFLAHYAGGMLAEAYRNNPDVDFHEMLIRMIHSPEELAVEGAMKLFRPQMKNTNFAIVYGAGLKKAAATAGVSVDVMKGVLETYHRKTDNLIHNLSQKAVQRAASRGYIVTWGGRKRRFRSAEWARAKGWRVYRNEKFVETHKALNALLQGSAADLIKLAMVKVAEIVDWQNTFLHLTVHDELDLSGPPVASDAGKRFQGQLREAMENFPLSSGVPIRVSIGTGPNWGATA